MYNDKYLNFLKQKYMQQNYPKDLNDYVISCIASSYSKNTRKKNLFRKFNPFIRLAIVASLSFIFLTSLGGKDYKINDFKINNGSPNTKRGVSSNFYEQYPNSEYGFFENDLIFSAHPLNFDSDLNGNFYNIDKESNKIVFLEDILIENIDSINDIDVRLKNNLLDKRSEFFVNTNGNYVIVFYDDVGNVFTTEIDDLLEGKIFKEKYILKKTN